MNDYEDSEYLPLSGIEHLVYCERQCALIHVERVWIENRYTYEGRIVHNRVDEENTNTYPDRLVVRSMKIISHRLRLFGVADVVELQKTNGNTWLPYPIEYKRGRRKRWLHDEVQVCAQAMALEEMLGVPVPRGAIFYGATARRREIIFDSDLRTSTEEGARRYHEIVKMQVTPPAKLDARCRHCSLEPLCLPSIGTQSGIRHLKSATRP